MATKNFEFTAKRSDHNRECMYIGCYYYDPNATTFCCGACSCSSDAYDASRLVKEAKHAEQTR